ncbi:MAG: response regulator [Bacteroidota bacterium]
MVILSIDDDAEDIAFFSEAIKQIDPTITYLTASNGEEGLVVLRNTLQLPHLIFLDINMHIMDGKSCLMEIMKDDRLKRIPVIMYSTTSLAEEIAEYQRLGAMGFLVKPNEFSSLCRALSEILTYPRTFMRQCG